MKIINLKTEYNERGYLGECFADNYMAKYGTVGVLSRPWKFYGVTEDHKKYLESFGAFIDGYKVKFRAKRKQGTKKYFDIAVAYEVKTRWEGTKSKKHYLTKNSLNAYEEAIKLEIPVKLVIIMFYNNFDIKIEDVDFHKKHFKIY